VFDVLFKYSKTLSGTISDEALLLSASSRAAVHSLDAGSPMEEAQPYLGTAEPRACGTTSYITKGWNMANLEPAPGGEMMA
jgi:hypothetical protein